MTKSEKQTDVRRKFKKADFPFFKSKSAYGLKIRIYRILVEMNNDKEFESEDELLDFLKGKTESRMLQCRKMGRKGLDELINWVENKISA